MANISFGTFKGGAGKSTICACVGIALARRGESVTILDLDENATLSRWFEKVREAGIHDQNFPSLTVQGVKREQFSAVYRSEPIKAADHVLMDLAGVRDDTYTAAVGRSTLVIVPIQQSEPDVHEAERVLELIADVEEMTGRSIPHRLLLNRVPTLATRLGAFVHDHITARGHAVFDTAIGQRVAYPELFTSGQPPQLRDPTRAGPEIDALMAEIDAIHAGGATQRRARA